MSDCRGWKPFKSCILLRKMAASVTTKAAIDFIRKKTFYSSLPGSLSVRRCKIATPQRSLAILQLRNQRDHLTRPRYDCVASQKSSGSRSSSPALLRRKTPTRTCLLHVCRPRCCCDRPSSISHVTFTRAVQSKAPVEIDNSGHLLPSSYSQSVTSLTVYS